MVVAGKRLFVRAYRGPGSCWYQAALAARQGWIRARGDAWQVTLSPADDQPHGDIVGRERLRPACPQVRPHARARNAVWRPPFVMYYRTCPLSAVRNDLTASGFTVTTIPLTALGRREDGSPKARLVLARTASTP